MGSGKTLLEVLDEKTIFLLVTEDKLLCKIGKDADERSGLVTTAVVH